jgi:hypothetical protein
MLNLKLVNPARAGAFENAYNNDNNVFLESWLDIRSVDGQLLLPLQRGLLIGSWLTSPGAKAEGMTDRVGVDPELLLGVEMARTQGDRPRVGGVQVLYREV